METTTGSNIGAEILERLMVLGMEALTLAKNERRAQGLDASGPAFEQAFARHLRERMAQAAQALVLEQHAAVELAEELGVAKTKAAIARGMSVIAAAQPHLRDRSRAVEQLAGATVST